MHALLLDYTQVTLNLVGVFVFGISGALLAVRKGYDIVGMTVLAEITALGGGLARDVLLGSLPPAALTHPAYLLLPLAGTVAAFFLHPQFGRLRSAVLLFDAAGLGVYAVSGAAKALEFGLGPVPAVALGAVTAVGGGILRDVLANETPAVFRADGELYAVPAVLGAALVVGAQRAGLYGPLAAGSAAGFVFALRVIALRYGWKAPHPRGAQGD